MTVAPVHPGGHTLREGAHRLGRGVVSVMVVEDSEDRIVRRDTFILTVVHPGPEVTTSWLAKILDEHGIGEDAVFTVERMNTPDGSAMKVEFYW